MNTVLIIDDHDIVRFGLELLVSASPALTLCGSAADLRTGLALISERKPTLVISDMSMDDSKGLDTVRAVVEAQDDRFSLIVSMHDEMLYGEQVLALGAQGYLMKENAHAQVIPAALAILDGQTWVSPKLSAKLLSRVTRRGQRSGAHAAPDEERALSMREVQVLELLGRGKTTKEIAFELVLSTRTVDIHRSNIKRKLGLRSGAEVVAFALSRT